MVRCTDSRGEWNGLKEVEEEDLHRLKFDE